jgi:hypothetical protein
MDRRGKVELFEQIRREYRFGVGTIRGVAKRFGSHRRIVREAIASAVPPERKVPARPLVAAYAIQADVAHIFLRAEYKLAAERLSKAIAEAYESHYLGKNILGSDYSLEMCLHVSSGATCAARRPDC